MSEHRPSAGLLLKYALLGAGMLGMAGCHEKKSPTGNQALVDSIHDTATQISTQSENTIEAAAFQRLSLAQEHDALEDARIASAAFCGKDAAPDHCKSVGEGDGLMTAMRILANDAQLATRQTGPTDADSILSSRNEGLQKILKVRWAPSYTAVVSTTSNP